MRTSLALLTLLAVLGGTGNAQAQTFNNSAVFKTVKDGKPTVYIGSRTANAEVTLYLSGVQRSRNVTANDCGLIVIKNSDAAPLSSLQSVGGQAVNLATLPTQLLPRCTNGVLEEARTANFKTGGGDLVVVATARASLPAVYKGDATRKVKANACGFVVLRGTSTQPIEGLTFRLESNPDATNHQVATLSTAPQDPICRQGILYTPDTPAWNRS